MHVVAGPSVAADSGAELGFPWGWLTIGLLVVAGALAIRSELRMASHSRDWYDAAMALYVDGCALGDAVRIRATHQDARQPEAWNQVLSRSDELVAAARRLGEDAPGQRERDRVIRLADEATFLRDLVQSRTVTEIPPAGRTRDEVASAAVAFDAALLEMRAAL